MCPNDACKTWESCPGPAADPGVQSGLKKMAVTPGGPTGDAFKKRIDADIKSFGDVVKAAKLTFK